MVADPSEVDSEFQDEPVAAAGEPVPIEASSGVGGSEIGGMSPLSAALKSVGDALKNIKVFVFRNRE